MAKSDGRWGRPGVVAGLVAIILLLVAGAQALRTSLRDTKTPIHHAATAWYSWIRPPRRSRRLISGTIVTGSMWLGLEGTRSLMPR